MLFIQKQNLSCAVSVAHKPSSLQVLLLGWGIRGILKKLWVAVSVISQFLCSKCLKACKWIFHRALPPAVGSPFPHISLLTNPPGTKNLQNNDGLTKFWAIRCLFVCSMSCGSPTEQRLPQNVRKKKYQQNKRGKGI